MPKALIVVDVQNDFCQGGSLAVPCSLQIFPVINALKQRKSLFDCVILTRDWHPENHVSFASTHRKEPFTSIQLEGKVQELWPKHCIANSDGAQLSPLLELEPTDIIVNKGVEVNVDSYSGFYWSKNGNELKSILQLWKIEEVYVCGLSFDFCVGSTALDAKKFGFKAFIIEQATKSVSSATQKIMKEKLKQAEVQIIPFSQVK